eukprot:m.17782 g.17782  ORF g.17782 m.17782 type:complete len:230 (+) comp5546_c0_seq1:127-816(+)
MDGLQVVIVVVAVVATLLLVLAGWMLLAYAKQRKRRALGSAARRNPDEPRGYSHLDGGSRWGDTDADDDPLNHSGASFQMPPVRASNRLLTAHNLGSSGSSSSGGSRHAGLQDRVSALGSAVAGSAADHDSGRHDDAFLDRFHGPHAREGLPPLRVGRSGGGSSGGRRGSWFGREDSRGKHHAEAKLALLQQYQDGLATCAGNHRGGLPLSMLVGDSEDTIGGTPVTRM